jgi:hypothetical protein
MAYNNKVKEALGKFMKVVNKKLGWRCIECPSRRSGLGSAVVTAKRASPVPVRCG